MIQTIGATEFIDAFRAYNRYDQFGHETLETLFNYLEDIDPNMELDVIALCCEYSVDSWQDIASNYSIVIDGMDEGDAIEAVRDYLNHKTSVVAELDGSSVFVYAQF